MQTDQKHKSPEHHALHKVRAALGPDNNTVGTTIEITLTGFNGDNPIAAKVDTGAQTCSLHAEDMEVVTDDVSNNSTVKFNFGQSQYNMNVDGFQSITSADGGTVQRPMVKFSVRINDQVYPDVVFNLNDRGHMDFPILVGLNLIKTAELIIDANISEMEVAFGGPNGMEQVTGTVVPPGAPETNQQATVDHSVVIDDSVDQQLHQSIIAWYQANRSKTIEQVFQGMVGTLVTNQGTNNDTSTD